MSWAETITVKTGAVEHSLPSNSECEYEQKAPAMVSVLAFVSALVR